MLESFIKNNKRMKRNALKVTNGQQKSGLCPFCTINRAIHLNEERLLDDKESGLALVPNKYPAFEDFNMWLVIEFHTCEKHLQDYTVEESKKFFRFMQESVKLYKETYPEDKELIIFKQVGEHAGGSVYHGHSQIIGSSEIDIDHMKIKRALNGGNELYNANDLKVRVNTQTVTEGEMYIFEFSECTNLDLLINKFQKMLRELCTISPSYSISYHDYDGKKYLQLVSRKTNSTPFIHFGTALSNVLDVEELEYLSNIIKD